MKTLLLTAVLALTSTSTLAESTKEDNCAAMYELASTVMEKRQQEMPIPKMIEAVNGNELAKLLIMEAYKNPAYSVESNQVKEVKRFANKIYAMCLEV